MKDPFKLNLKRHDQSLKFDADVNPPQELFKRLSTLELVSNYYNLIVTNPDERIRSEGIAAYDRIYSDPVVKGCIDTIVQSLKGLEWEIQAWDAREDAVALFDGIFTKLMDQDIIEKIAMAIFYGQKYLDIIWEKSNNRTVPKLIVEKANESFLFIKNRETGEHDLHYLTPDSRYEGQPVPPYKVLLPTYESTYSNPYGRGLLANCYKAVFIKDNAWSFWAIMVEDHGTPKLDVQVDGSVMGKLEQDFGGRRAAMREIMRDVEKIKSNAAFVHTAGVEVKPLTAAAKDSGATHDDLINYCDKQIAILLLGHNGSSQSTPGKLGSEEAAMTVLSSRIASYSNFIAKYVNQLFRWIYELNFGDKGTIPQIRFFEKDDLSLYQAKADYLTKLGAAGYKLKLERVAELINEEVDNLIEIETKSTPPGDENDQAQEEPTKEEPKDQDQPSEKEEQQSFIMLSEVSEATDEFEAKLSAQADADYDALKQFSDMVINGKDFDKAAKEMMDYVAEFIGTSNSVEEMVSKLNDIYEDMPTSKLIDLVTRMQLVVTAYGISAAAASEEED